MYKLKMDGTYKSKMDSTFRMLQSGFAQFVNWMKMDMRQVHTSNYDTPTLLRSQATATENHRVATLGSSYDLCVYIWFPEV